MGVEIERKFLIVDNSWKSGVTGVRITQGYLSVDPKRAIRVRILDDQAILTIKGMLTDTARHEFEWPIPIGDAMSILDSLCLNPIIEKTRYEVPHMEHVWEIDEFHGENDGLVVAEIELSHEAEIVPLPPWVGREVTHDPRYLNVNLVQHPYGNWEQEDRTGSRQE